MNVEVSGMQSTAFGAETIDTKYAEQAAILQSLLDIKQDIKRDVCSLTSKLDLVDHRIDTIIASISVQSSSGSPNPSTVQLAQTLTLVLQINKRKCRS